MNKTLYIGAKCVPSFYIGSGGSSAWASGVPYEPLTVVTYNGSWYISKIAVPASTTAPAAGTYWAKVPGYLTELDASFIEWAQEHIGDLEDDVEELQGDVAELKDDLSDITEKSKNVLPIASKSTELVSCNVDYSDGIISVKGTASGSGGRMTRMMDDFHLKVGSYALSKYKIYSDPSISNNIALILQTYNGTVVAILDAAADTVEFSITDSSITYFIGVNFIENNYYNLSYNIQLEKNTKTAWTPPSLFSAVDTIARKEAYAPNILAAYKNIYCIGDSLTYGQVYTGASTSRRAISTYPQILGKMLGVEVSQNAIGGFSAKDWWDAFSANITEKDGQLVIVYLGTNGGLTDTMTSDIIGNDYSLWADTDTGDYAKIIAKSLSVGANVLLIKPWTTDGNIETTKKVIEQMADKFGCGLLESIPLSDDVYHLYPDKSGKNTVHLNDIGYAAFADMVIKNTALMDCRYMQYMIPIISE